MYNYYFITIIIIIIIILLLLLLLLFVLHLWCYNLSVSKNDLDIVLQDWPINYLHIVLYIYSLNSEIKFQFFVSDLDIIWPKTKVQCVC